MAPIPGWYDDPRDASQLRYWDGAAWTENVTAKDPTPAPSPPPAQWQYPGAPPAQQQVWQYGAPPQDQQVIQQPGAAKAGPTTPDGVRITTWGKRLAARILDLLIVGIGGLPFTGYFAYKCYQATSAQLDAEKSISFIPTADVIKWESAMVAMFLVVYLAYELFCLDHWGATPGKRVMEISVRRLDRPGKLPWSTIIRRVAFMFGLAGLTLVPVISFLAVIAILLNYLWPLWDDNRQALHDRGARTVVVEGPQSVGVQSAAALT